MLSCDACRPLIPDLLYGLLDAPEEAAAAAHLAACPACAAARDEAARVQGLIAAAARGTFPAVRFEPPAARPKPAPAAPTRRTAVVPFPDPAARNPKPVEPARGRTAAGRSAGVTYWLPWAVAAAVLVAVPGTVVPVRGLLDRAETARADADRLAEEATAARLTLGRAVADAGRPLADAQLKLIAARQEHDGLAARWVAAEQAAAQAAEGRQLTWGVQKPAAVQPGAPNEFLIVVRDHGAAPPGRLVAEVRDQTDAVVHSQPINPERAGDHTVRLPAAVWRNATPQTELFLAVARVDGKTGAKTDLPDRVRLLGPVYATALTTDRAAYRPGETVYFRSLTLDRVTLTPPAREQVLQYELRGPGGHPVVPPVAGSTDLVRVGGAAVEPVRGPDGAPLRGVGSGAFALPADARDGDYTLVLRELASPAGGPPAVPFPVTRAIKVRAGSAEAFRKQIAYGAASYAPGDTVEARAKLQLGDDPVAGAEVKAVATADGRALEVAAVGGPVTGADGEAVLRFALPADLNQADVRLMATFRTRSGKDLVEEVVAAPVPVVGRSAAVEFFPEGGTLIAGVPCRVYVRATTPAGQPVDVRGVVTDGRRELARVETLTDPVGRGANRGIGSFTFTPELGLPVWLRLDASPARFPTAPAAVTGAAAAAARTGFLLPRPKAEGVVMTVPDPVTVPGQPVRVQLRSVGRDRKLVVGAYTRGRLSDTKEVAAAAGQVAEVSLMAGTDPRGGVVRVTVFEEPDEAADAKADLIPVAERLVFRKPGEVLDLKFAANGAAFAPGSAVELGVAATDEKGRPAAAVLYAAAVSAAAAPGDTDRLPTTHFLLAGEVSTPDALEHADFLLTDHPKAAEALDGVLATQGWRRFAEQTPAGFARNPVVRSADRWELAACNGQYTTWAEPGPARDARRARAEHLQRFNAAVEALEAAKAAAEVARAAGPADTSAARADADRAAAAAAAAGDRAARAAAPVADFRASGWYAVGGLGLLALLLGGAALVRPGGRLPLGAGTLGAAGLAAFLVAALGTADRLQAAARPGDESARASLPDPAPAAPAVAPDPRPASARVELGARPTTDLPVVPGRTTVPMSAGGFGNSPEVLAGGLPAKKWWDSKGPPEAGLVKGGPPRGNGKDLGWQPGRPPEIPGDLLGRVEADRPAAGRTARAEAATAADDLQRGLDRAKEYASDKANVVRRQLDTALRQEGYFAEVRPPAPSVPPGVAQAAPAARPAAPSADALAVLRVKAAVPEVPPLVVREYAAPRPGADRAADPGDTVLWQPVIVLPSDGKAKLQFHAGAARGGYQVIVAGHTLDGRVGAVRGVIPVAAPAPAVPAVP
jgi:hypothetical protein